MNNLTTYIVVTLVVFITLGIFWIAGGGIYLPKPDSSATAGLNDNKKDKEDNGTILAVFENKDGRYLVDQYGLALYTTTREECNGTCLNIWPPYRASKEVANGRLGVFGVEGVGAQYTWDGALLYYYSNDKAVGDTNGHELEGEWFLARP